ncbi:MAG: M48 family metalloprotease [Terriglobia bacterium]|jgi:hypothetical protein
MIVSRRYAGLPPAQVVILSGALDRTVQGGAKSDFWTPMGFIGPQKSGNLGSLLPVMALSVLLLIIPSSGYCQGAQGSQVQPPAQASGIIDRIIAGEHRYVENLKKYSPRVETYLQYDDADTELGDKVRKDAYFLGRMSFAGKPQEISFTPVALGDFHWLHSGLRRFKAPFVTRLMVDQFMTATLVDAQTFDTQHYSFEPVGWEYLGDVRCLALDVHPQGRKIEGAFEGRIWVEDRNYAIVRLNGVRVNPRRLRFYTHFDSWRENLQPHEWLPVYIYSEESDPGSPLRYKATTRLWGYDLTAPRQQEAWTKILVDAPVPVRDSSDAASDLSPVEGKRQMELEAEQNVLWRLEKAGLIAPPGPVDKIAETVLNNLVVTNNLTSLPTLHCRVLLTSPLESFPLRYTIVLSRGLLDVLPDEPGLAMILAHELAHVVLGHKLDTMYAFNDRLILRDEDLLQRLDFAREPKEEAAADAKAVEFLKNSPYKDKLGNAGLFLRAAAAAAPHTPELFGAHLGDRMVTLQGGVRLGALMGSAPELQPSKTDQIAALPLGSRVQVNAWDGSVSFPNRKSVALVDPSEKMPFQLAPQFPHLTRYEEVNGTNVAAQQSK